MRRGAKEGEAKKIGKGERVIRLATSVKIKQLPFLSRMRLNSEQLAAHICCVCIQFVAACMLMER